MQGISILLVMNLLIRQDLGKGGFLIYWADSISGRVPGGHESSLLDYAQSQ